ncbi:Omp28-related outer membrane protein [uncultured Flavobacterium sp.]|uniref:Omp28-related outer membrane protein n=1 Tax=uncultured Flavobacterium sp. TaxID=165435 RepID=UPI0030CA1D7B|tara:strand:- start:659 stop:1711 length:1053 start_codon:yes stop_codon:yes gene_type:complete
MKFIKLLVLSLILFVSNSCSENYTVLESVESIIVTADNSFSLINETVTLSAYTSTGEDVTAVSVFYINNNALNSNVFTSNTIGEFTVTSSYLGIISAPVVITFHDGTQVNFRKRVLLEDYTGTWCGYCTRVAYAIEQVNAITDDVVAVAIHRSSSIPTNSNYDPYNYDTSALENLFPISGYPKGLINRFTQWTTPQENNLAQVTSLTQGANPKLGLSMNNTVVGNNILLDVKVKFSNSFTNLKLVVYVLENGLVYSQKNYTSYYGGVNPITNYVHNHTLRSCITDLFGDSINNTEPFSGNVYTKSFDIPVPANVSNASNIEFVAFVVDENGNALNVRKAAKNENQSFEEL